MAGVWRGHRRKSSNLRDGRLLHLRGRSTGVAAGKIFALSLLTYIAPQCINIQELVMLSKELVAASAEPLILSLLSGGESYGYAIIQEIKARSKERIQWTDGMLYPVLHRMEDEGWITSRWVEAENGRK